MVMLIAHISFGESMVSGKPSVCRGFIRPHANAQLGEARAAVGQAIKVDPQTSSARLMLPKIAPGNRCWRKPLMSEEEDWP
jgi:hypothetical protein